MAREDNRAIQGPPEEERSARTAMILILAAFALALVIRGVSAWHCGPAGPQEVRYITIAQGLLNGSGFQGLDERFPDIIQPPLHMWLLAVALLVVGDPLPAARGLTVLLGGLLVFPVAILAWRLYGHRTAWRAALLVAMYPLLVHFSGLALTEPVFGLLIACSALLLQSVAAGRGRLIHPAGAGACLGLAFLARPEGLAYLAALSVFMFILLAVPLKRGLAAAAGWTGLFIACFMAFAVPYSAWLHQRTGHWRISPKAALTQVHNLIMTEGLRENWPEREGTAVFYERVKFGLNAEGTELRSAEIFRSLGLLPSDGRPAPEISLVGDVIRPSFLIKVVLRNFRHLYLETLKYGLVLPTLFLGLLFVGFTAGPWRVGPARRSQILLAWFLMAGCSWALSYVQGRFLYASIGLIVPWVARGWLRTEEWIRESVPEVEIRGGRLAARGITVAFALVLGGTAVAHAIPPAELTRELWRYHRDAGEELARIAAPGDPVMGLTPVVSFYAGLPFELLPYADLDQVIRFARLRGVRYLVADLHMLRLQRPQLMSLQRPDLAPEGLRAVVTTGAGGDELVIIYEILPENGMAEGSSAGAPAPYRLP